MVEHLRRLLMVVTPPFIGNFIARYLVLMSDLSWIALYDNSILITIKVWYMVEHLRRVLMVIQNSCGSLFYHSLSFYAYR